MDKMEYLIEQAHDKLTNNDYENINVLYRSIFAMYNDSEDLSPNERFIISDKIQDLFQRIKRVYLIEGAT